MIFDKNQILKNFFYLFRNGLYFGNPYRIKVYNIRQLNSLILQSQPSKPCFVNVYYKDTLTMNKIFFDVDYKDLDHALYAVKIFYRKFYRLFNILVVFSGKKGFHIYILLKISKIIKSDSLKKIQHKLVKISEADPDVFDTHVYGNLNVLCRIPFTLRENYRYCYVISDPLNIKLDQILSVSVNESYINNINITFDYQKFYSSNNFLSIVNNLEYIDYSYIENENEYEYNNNVYLFEQNVKNINGIRKCILELCSIPNPDHKARFVLVCELKSLGYNQNQIFDFISKLNWQDFDTEITRYQINHIFNKDYKKVTCSWLRSELFVKCERCVKKEVILK